MCNENIENLIEKLYNGEYSYVEQPMKYTKELKESLNRCNQCEKIIKSKLNSEKDKMLVDELCANYMSLQNEHEKRAYSAGIKFALQFVIEGLGGNIQR